MRIDLRNIKLVVAERTSLFRAGFLIAASIVLASSTGCQQSSTSELESTNSKEKTVNKVDRPNEVSLVNAVGQMAPELELEAVLGTAVAANRVRLDNLLGKVVVLEYWATW